MEGRAPQGFRSNMLMGVTSNRVDVKRMGALAERALERRAEPLAALFEDPRDWPEELLASPGRRWYATRPTIRSVPARSTMSSMRCCIATPRPGPLPMDWPTGRSSRSPGPSLSRATTSQPGPNARVRGWSSSSWGSRAADGRRPGRIRAHRPARFDGARRQHRPHGDGHAAGPKDRQRRLAARHHRRRGRRGVDITLTIGAEERPNVPISEAKQDIYARLGARPDAVFRIKLNQPPIRRIVARVHEVPGYGWQSFAPAALTHPVTWASRDGPARSLSNGLVTVEVDDDRRDLLAQRQGRVRPTRRRR
jgi:hypothetical protein